MDAEIAKNAEAFRGSLVAKITANIDGVFAASSPRIDDAYARLTTMQAWRSFVLDALLPPSALGFFVESQNDGLTSGVLVSSGLWRPGMKSLRSLIENVLRCFYFMDHPVEYRQWERGAKGLTFQKLFEYFEDHPDLKSVSATFGPAVALQGYYSQLSKVVHSSAKEFRMTDDIAKSKLWKTDNASVGQWATMQKNVCREVNILMLVLFADHLKGAKVKGLRESLSLSIPMKKDAAILKELEVRIIRA